MPWIFPVHKFAHWVSSVQVAHRRACADVLAVVVVQLRNNSLQLLQFVPTYDLYFDSTKPNLVAAEKLLAHWPAKKALGAGCIALESAMSNASKAHTTWCMDGTLSTDPRFAEQLVEVEAIYQKAKHALVTIAGVNCAVNLKGIARLQMRDSLLHRADFMPKTFLQCLQRLQ